MPRAALKVIETELFFHLLVRLLARPACLDARNESLNSDGRRFDIGVSDGSRRSDDLPLYTLANNATGERIQTTDPGRALVSGAWKDIGRFKVPTLRGAAARAPFFHDGSAASLRDAIAFVDGRFAIALTDAEKSDLLAFLNAL